MITIDNIHSIVVRRHINKALLHKVINTLITSPNSYHQSLDNIPKLNTYVLLNRRLLAYRAIVNYLAEYFNVNR